MKLAVYTFSDAGQKLAKKIMQIPEYNICISDRANLTKDFYKMDGLIFICATGIAVRLIAPLIQSKYEDPAVIVLDDAGHFTISLLSGHLGGANELAKKLASFLENTAVITTASDNRGVESLDIFAQRTGLVVDDFEHLKNAMACIINGKRVALYSEIKDEPFGIPFIKNCNFESDNIDYWVIISAYKIKTKMPACYLIPKNLYVGIGCKKNTEASIVKMAIEKACKKADVHTRGIVHIATIELKKNEPAIIEAAKFFQCPLKIYTNEEVNSISLAAEDKSDFVFKTTGVYAVSEPCARLSGATLILKKFKYNGVTVSLALKKEIEET
ncbi:MAG: cobalt-precorrin 5A hydrolase [Treponemataceae bacterium]